MCGGVGGRTVSFVDLEGESGGGLAGGTVRVERMGWGVGLAIGGSGGRGR